MSDKNLAMTMDEQATNVECNLQSPVPCVLVVGDFRKEQSIGFAKKAWDKIVKEYSEQRKGFGEAPSVREASEMVDYDEDPITIPHYTGPEDSPALYPIPLSDYGLTDSARFEFNLYQLFRRFNIVGVISCCTAKNTKGLAKALRPIDVPVLLALDSTLAGPEQFGANALQLIANNALQAQAVLGKVTVMLSDKADQLVQVYCSPEGDEYVEDLRNALQSNLKDNDKKIQPNYVTDPKKLEGRKK